MISEFPRLNREGFLKGLLQPENVGLIGFSMGGYGALRTIGARVNGTTRRLNDANIHFVTAFFDMVLQGEDG